MTRSVGLQDISVGGKTLPINKLHKKFTIDNLSDVTKITVPKNDVFLEGGSFALSKKKLFMNNINIPLTLDALPTPLGNYDYLIAFYPGIRQENGHLVTETTIPSQELLPIHGNYEFILNLPGLSENKRRFRLYELHIVLTRPPLTLKNVIPRIVTFAKKTLRSLTP